MHLNEVIMVNQSLNRIRPYLVPLDQVTLSEHLGIQTDLYCARCLDQLHIVPSQTGLLTRHKKTKICTWSDGCDALIADLYDSPNYFSQISACDIKNRGSFIEQLALMERIAPRDVVATRSIKEVIDLYDKIDPRTPFSATFSKATTIWDLFVPRDDIRPWPKDQRIFIFDDELVSRNYNIDGSLELYYSNNPDGSNADLVRIERSDEHDDYANLMKIFNQAAMPEAILYAFGRSTLDEKQGRTLHVACPRRIHVEVPKYHNELTQPSYTSSER
jgi:hypothetical protein